jgi:hypothetical protein
MHRTQIYLSDEQRELIARRAEDTGQTKAEVIRRMLDEALGLASDASARAAAVRDTAGILAEAPDWPEWLGAIRGRSADERLRELGM